MIKTSLLRALVATALLAALIGSERDASAYAYEGTYWSGAWPVVGYYINAASFPSSVGTQTQVINTIRKGVNHWNFESGVPLTFVYMGTSNIATTANDGTNVIYYDPSNCSSPLGPCMGLTTWWPATGALTGFDIRFNGRNSSGVAIPWTTTDPPVFKMDLWGYTAHEIGHAWGMAHSTYTTATMNAANAGLGSTYMRFLSTDDIAGIQALYGANAEIQTDNANPKAGTVIHVTVHFGDSSGLGYEFKASENGTSPGYNMSTTDAQDYRVLKLNTPWLNMAADTKQYTNITGSVSAGYATMYWDTTGQSGRCVNFAALIYDTSYSWPNNYRHISAPLQVCVQ